jgi:hypothetical protein
MGIEFTLITPLPGLNVALAEEDLILAETTSGSFLAGGNF